MKKKISYRHKRTVVDKLNCHAALIVAVGLILTGTVILGFAAKAEHINGILFDAVGAIFLLIWLSTRKG